MLVYFCPILAFQCITTQVAQQKMGLLRYFAVIAFDSSVCSSECVSFGSFSDAHRQDTQWHQQPTPFAIRSYIHATCYAQTIRRADRTSDLTSNGFCASLCSLTLPHSFCVILRAIGGDIQCGHNF
jgi:hypothetical protein